MSTLSCWAKRTEKHHLLSCAIWAPTSIYSKYLSNCFKDIKRASFEAENEALMASRRERGWRGPAGPLHKPTNESIFGKDQWDFAGWL